jgi:hypothetical protein
MDFAPGRVPTLETLLIAGFVRVDEPKTKAAKDV